MALHGRDELLHHLVVERGHGTVQYLEDVEHFQQLGDVPRRDVLHAVVLEEVIYSEEQLLRLQVSDQLADIRPQALDLAMLGLAETPDPAADAPAGLRELGLDLFT